MSLTGQESVRGERGTGAASVPLQSLFDIGTLTGLTDGQLLDRFARGEDVAAEAAFALLVDRHGPMVIKVCRDVLGDLHDAEDAFQATFLVLARRAGSIRRGDSVASWLYEVARRLAAAGPAGPRRGGASSSGGGWRRANDRAGLGASPEPWPELYEELDRLPRPFRAAVVLCDLKGHSYEQAAGLLGCPVGTLQSRLSRGRARLRRGLERRGLGTATVVACGRPLASWVGPEIPARLTTPLVRSAVSLSQGRCVASLLSPAVASLLGSEVRRNLMVQMLTSGISLLAAGLIVAGMVGLWAVVRDDPPEVGRAAPPNAKPSTEPIHVQVVDPGGRPTPGVTVHVVELSPAALPRTITTDTRGFIKVPAEGDRDGLVMLARAGGLAGLGPAQRA